MRRAHPFTFAALGALAVHAALAGVSHALTAPPAIDIKLESRAQQPGELIVLTVSLPSQVAPPRVQAFGRSVPVYSSRPDSATAGGVTWRALIGVDLDVKPGTYTLTVSSTKDANVRSQRQIVIAPKAFPTRKL